MSTVKVVCPRCKGDVRKSGRIFRRGQKRQRYECKKCGHAFVP